MLSKIKVVFLAVIAIFSNFAEAAHQRFAQWMGKEGLVMTANLYSQHTYDAALLLKAAGLVGASADGSLILDLGIGLFDGVAIIDATAVEVATGDEMYTILYEGSPDVGFTAGTLAVLAMIRIGAATPTAPQGFADLPGRFTVPLRNERNGVLYQFMRIRTVVVGTIAAGINYSTWLAKR